MQSTLAIPSAAAHKQPMKLPHTLFAVLLACSVIGCVSPTSPPTTQAHTPAKRSPERTRIITGVKASLAKQGRQHVVLEIPYLKVHSGWAWIQVNPQSADGTQHYESQSGLLQEKAQQWILLEWMPSEEGTDAKAYFKKLKAKYPQAPADIFPQ